MRQQCRLIVVRRLKPSASSRFSCTINNFHIQRFAHMTNTKSTILYPSIFIVFSLIFLLTKIDAQDSSLQKNTKGYFGVFYEEHYNIDLARKNHNDWRECVRSRTGHYPVETSGLSALEQEDTPARLGCSVLTGSAYTTEFSFTKFIINFTAFSLIPALAIFLIMRNRHLQKNKEKQ